MARLPACPKPTLYTTASRRKEANVRHEYGREGTPAGAWDNAAAVAARRLGIGRVRGGLGRPQRLPDDLGAEHQGCGLASGGVAGRRDPEDRREGQKGPRIY